MQGEQITPSLLLASEPQVRARLGDERSFELDVTFKFKWNWIRAFFQCLEVTRKLLCLHRAVLRGRSEHQQSTRSQSQRWEEDELVTCFELSLF